MPGRWRQEVGRGSGRNCFLLGMEGQVLGPRSPERSGPGRPSVPKVQRLGDERAHLHSTSACMPHTPGKISAPAVGWWEAGRGGWQSRGCGPKVCFTLLFCWSSLWLEGGWEGRGEKAAAEGPRSLEKWTYPAESVCWGPTPFSSTGSPYTQPPQCLGAWGRCVVVPLLLQWRVLGSSALGLRPGVGQFSSRCCPL